MKETELARLEALGRFVAETDLKEWRRQIATAVPAGPAFRERRSRVARKACTPAVNAKKAAASRKRFEDSAQRAKARAGTAAMWTDPARRAERLAHIQEYWRRWREERDKAKGPTPLPLPGAVPTRTRGARDSGTGGRFVEVDGARLRALRESLGLTTREAASRAGMTPGNLSFIENGHRRPTLASAARLANIYRVPVSELAVLR